MRRLLLVLLACLPWVASAAAPEDLLEPERAFRFSARALDAHTLELRYAIADGYYMYRDKFRFAVRDADAKLGDAAFPPAKLKQDPFFGAVETYRGNIAIKVPVQGDWQVLALEAVSQGCADIGVCYPPLTQNARVELAGMSVAPAATTVPSLQEFGRRIEPVPDAPNDESRFERLLASGSFWLIVAGFFGAGLLLTFTPCVLPMVPILAGLIVGEGRGVTRRHALLLSLAYVAGMAVTYTAIGVAAALSGSLLSAALQNAWVLGLFALVFVALALSMFGLYDLQLPAALQSKAHSAASTLKGGRYGAVALMGVLSAAVVSPCIAAPLAGALLYISQTRDAALGGAALFAMALGMGLPLVAVGVSEGAL